ncbi:hypothetical protein NFJ02_14g16310 [Pycnococcus provasolii]
MPCQPCAEKIQQDGSTTDPHPQCKLGELILGVRHPEFGLIEARSLFPSHFCSTRMAAAVEEEAAAPVAVAPNGNANNAAEAENGDQPDVLRGLFGAVMQGVKYYMFFQLAMMLMGGSANNFRQIANSSAATGTGSLANQATSPSEAATHGQTAEAGGGGGRWRTGRR